MKNMDIKKLGLKVVTAVVAASLLAGGAFASVSFAKRSDVNVATVQDDTDIEAEVVDAVSENQAVDKEETVYIIANADGSAEKTIVSCHLHNNDGADVIDDVTTLTDIENVKGYEDYSVDGDNIKWNAAGNEIFYQGNTQKEIPVTTKITYYLEGKEMKPEDMAGVSGRVTIRFDYTNNEKTGDVYVPFVAISGLVLDDSYSKVSVTNGHVMTDGGRTVVIGYALPGLTESIVGEGQDIGLPTYFEMSADVEDFKLDTTVTVIANASNLKNDIESDKIASIDEMLGNLTGSGEQLVEGSEKLKAGAESAYEGSSKLEAGAKQLDEGVKQLAGIIEGMSSKLSDAKNNIYKQFESQAGMPYDYATGTVLPALKKCRDALSMDDYATAAVIYNQINSTNYDASVMQAKKGTFLSGLNEKIDLLNQAVGKVNGAVEAIDGVGAQLGGGDSAEKLKKLTEGSTQLAAGLTDLTKGLKTLSDGAGTLNEGVTEFKNSTLAKISEAYGGDVQTMTDRIAMIKEAGRSYKTFTGIVDEQTGSVKFIIRTAAIK